VANLSLKFCLDPLCTIYLDRLAYLQANTVRCYRHPDFSLHHLKCVCRFVFAPASGACLATRRR